MKPHVQNFEIFKFELFVLKIQKCSILFFWDLGHYLGPKIQLTDHWAQNLYQNPDHHRVCQILQLDACRWFEQQNTTCSKFAQAVLCHSNHPKIIWDHIMTGQSSVLRWLCCGPEISAPQHDQIVWSCCGPGRALVLLHRENSPKVHGRGCSCCLWKLQQRHFTEHTVNVNVKRAVSMALANHVTPFDVGVDAAFSETSLHNGDFKHDVGGKCCLWCLTFGFQTSNLKPQTWLTVQKQHKFRSTFE